MSTTIRAELSDKNPYWIERHRYYELKHFCLQYPLWKRTRQELDGYGQKSAYVLKAVTGRFNPDPTLAFAEARTYYSDRMGMIERAARESNECLSGYLIKGVTEGFSYDILKARLNIPCCKDVYYEAYRRFFWTLDRIRK